MDKDSRLAFKITLALFLSALGTVFLLTPASATSWHYHRRTRVGTFYWFTLELRLNCDAKAYYRTESGDDITSYYYNGFTEVFATSTWVTFGYSSSHEEASSGGYYIWIKLSNSAHFETRDGYTHIILSAWCKVSEFYAVSWSGSYQRLYGYASVWGKDNILISVA